MEGIRELVEQALSGDRTALEKLISKFQGMAVGYAWSIVGDYQQAEDLAQEAFIQAIAGIGRLRNPAAFPLWFKTLLRYTCTRHLRRRRPIAAGIHDAVWMAESLTAEEGALANETRRAIRRTMDRLGEEDRSILVLYYFEEMTHRQIAEFLGLPDHKVNNRLHALRTKLKKEWMHLMEYKKTGVETGFRNRVLEGIEKIGYSSGHGKPMLTQFCGSLSAALPAMGASPQLDYIHVAGVSGAAFRLVWKDGWHPDNVDLLIAMEDSFEPMRRAFAASGCIADFCVCDGSAIPWAHNSIAGAIHRNELQARSDIMESIDRGIPVLALGVIGPPECCIVTGYGMDGAVLTGYNYFQDYIKEDGLTIDGSGRFHKKGWFGNTAAYFIIRECRVALPNREMYLDTLRLAVHLARTPEVNGRAAGLAAYRAWADQLLYDDEYESMATGDGDMNFAGKGTADFSVDVTGRFGMFCDPFLMVCERASAADFCERAAMMIPESAEALQEAAAYYRKVASNPNDLWQRLGLYENKQERFRDPDVRSILAGQLLRLRLLEEKAVLCLEKALLNAGA